MRLMELIGIIVLIFVIQFAFITLYQRLIMPLRIGKNTSLDAVLHVTGDAPELEVTVKNLLYMKKSGGIKMDIYIMDDGMSESARKTAELLTRDTAGVVFVSCRED
ncbi:MAG: hypothetical protein GX111_04605 [Clostridiales bacterium]|jgi:hypothetical protein|nr:hypothetical protein [Clostridiales bacterium]